MHALGPAYATQYIQRFGFPDKSLPRNLSLALGTAHVSPLEMASAYAVFANGGFRVEPYYLQRVIGPDSKVMYEAEPLIACAECVKEEMKADEDLLDAPIRAEPSDESRWGGLTYIDQKRVAPMAISPQNSYLMSDMMRDVVARGTAVRAMQLKRGDLAGKTGTTE